MSNLYKFTETSKLKNVFIRDFCTLFTEDKPIISLVGAGGKTTLLYLMAQGFSANGKKVLVITTTHIYRPTDGRFAETEEEVKILWERGTYAVVGEKEKEKLTILPEFRLKTLISLADIVLIEADGAKKMPFKVPKQGEPVILPCSNVVIGILGLNALGKPLSQVCFRLEEAKKRLKKEENQLITVEDFISVMDSPHGLGKGVGTRRKIHVLSQFTQNRLKPSDLSLFYNWSSGKEVYLFGKGSGEHV